MKQKLSTLKHPSNFSRPQLAIFVLIFALVGFLIYRTFATGPLVASLEAEQMTLPPAGSIVTDANASAGKAIQLLSNGTATGSVNFPASVTSITVNARGDQCSGAPMMTVSVDGNAVLSNASVASTSWTSYSITPPNAFNAGTHTLSIAFSNDYYYTKNKGNSGKTITCDRNLYVDVTNFYGSTPAPTPAPTVTLSASPTSLTAGQASTLTWGSTNASSCTASGAWSGAEPTSGSTSTGALNQNSTYTLTCTGAGGTASASATVSVSTVTGTGGAWLWDAKTATVDSSSASKLSASHISGFGSSSYFQATVARADTVSGTAGYSMSPVYGTDSSVYVPLGSQGGSNSDRHLWVYDKVHARETDLWLSTYDTSTLKISKISGGVSMPLGAVTEPSNGSATAARLPLGRGLITPADVASGIIAHPLAFSIPSADIAASPSSVYPASTAYGGTGSGGVSFGSWLRLNPSVNCPGLGMPKLETMMCVALQNYGMFLRDIGSNMSIYGQDTVNQGGYTTWTNVGVTLPLINSANGRHYAQQLSSAFPWGSMQLLIPPAK